MNIIRLFPDDEDLRPTSPWAGGAGFCVGMLLAAPAVTLPLCPAMHREPPAPIHEHVPHDTFGHFIGGGAPTVFLSSGVSSIAPGPGVLSLDGWPPTVAILVRPR